MSVDSKKVVTISYTDLVNSQGDAATEQEVLVKIGQAFGDDDECLGILAVTDVPRLESLRHKLLPMARDLAMLPEKELDAVTDEVSGYQVGWSHGKEKVEGDKLDLAKGSFYANPLTDNLLENCPDTDPKVVRDNPSFFAPNVWPTSSLPEFEQAFKDLGLLVCDVGRLLARYCDSYVKSKCQGYPAHKLEHVLTKSIYCKARLLHYYPTESFSDDNGGAFSDWCGWHNDHGSLTGLVPAIYLDEDGVQVACPDGKAGLYIKSRTGKLVHVLLPPRSLGFQIGETSQIHTGGVFQATPHAVRGCRGGKISRESFAVFMEPEISGLMNLPSGKTVEDIQRQTAHLPSTVKTLQSRWKPGMNFGEFSEATFAAFY